MSLFDRIEVPTDSLKTDIRIDGVITHQCPFVDETDYGTIAVRYTPYEYEIELHSFKNYLGSFEDTKISHEDLTRRIWSELEEWINPARLSVNTSFKTAGLAVNVEVS